MQAQLLELQNTLQDLACGLQRVAPVLNEPTMNYFRNIYKYVVKENKLPPPKEQERIRNAAHFINEKIDYLDKLVILYKAVAPIVGQGITESNFKCPMCGGNAQFKMQIGGKKVEYAACQNQCFKTKE